MRIAVAGGISTGARQALDILHTDGEMPVLDKESIVYKMYNRPAVVDAIKVYFGDQAAEVLKNTDYQNVSIRDLIDRNKLKKKIIDSGRSDIMLDIERITGPVVSDIIDAFHRRHPGTTAVETPGLLEYDVVHHQAEKFNQKFHPIMVLFCDREQQRINCLKMIQEKMRQSSTKYTIEEIHRRIDILLSHELSNEEKIRQAQHNDHYMVDTTGMTADQLRQEIHLFMKKYDIPIIKSYGK